MLAEFGSRLTLARRARGFRSRAPLARIVGVHTDTVGTWEVGRNYPKPPELQKLCQVLGVTADWLLFGDPAGLSPQAYELLISGRRPRIIR